MESIYLSQLLDKLFIWYIQKIRQDVGGNLNNCKLQRKWEILTSSEMHNLDPEQIYYFVLNHLAITNISVQLVAAKKSIKVVQPYQKSFNFNGIITIKCVVLTTLTVKVWRPWAWWELGWANFSKSSQIEPLFVQHVYGWNKVPFKISGL